ncbi:RNA methyltransferase [uncultured Flavobacterium sp.]|mgnify:CR=1 FL=1|uniref:TrmH family RNA methyltransferase n=1 Tax=uncultured Flavobacterium sp. TaxID=165435 RepID=UPI0030CA38CA|tara:strand:- start:117 stop:848 length:732 start_codon:yes stop_codon:yes gene_type:complete
MISKNQIKLIKSLQQKKYRKLYQLFFAEGVKVIQELLNSNYELVEIFTINELFLNVEKSKINFISETELKSISSLVTPNECLAVFIIPETELKDYSNTLQIALDDIRDPGNMGTIIRLADWFGVQNIICSEATVDVYNPKVIQATMGSIARVHVVYCDLKAHLSEVSVPIYGTLLQGSAIYSKKLIQPSIIVLGNESNGISKNIQQLITHKITIPRFGSLQQTESLNVATAAAIVLSEFCRNN